MVRSRFNLLLLCAVLPLAAPAHSRAESETATSRDEGGELVISESIVFRELPIVDGNPLPLIAVGTASGDHYFYDPNQLAMQGYWSGVSGKLGEGSDFVPANSKMKSFALERTQPWSYGARPRRQLDHEWLGYGLRDGKACFLCRLNDPPSRSRNSSIF